MDLPVWQAMYEDLKGKGFTVIAVALDSGGNEAARPWIEAAKPGYPCLIDREHKLSEAVGIINVPSAVWIDEAGRIVRPAEPAGASDSVRARDPKTGQVPADVQAKNTQRREHYYEALRDWVNKGPKSAYVLEAAEAQRRVRLPSKERALAAANFQLGVHLSQQGRQDEAQSFFDEALRLWPEAWTFRRQAWNLNPPAGIPANQRNELAMKSSGVTFFREDLEMVDA